jgi:hypothetical protein
VIEPASQCEPQPGRLRLLSVPLGAVTIAASVWIAAGLITNDFRVSMALTGVWLLLCALGCLQIAVRHRALRDRVVHEGVVTGRPTSGPHAGSVEQLRSEPLLAVRDDESSFKMSEDAKFALGY